MSRELQIGDNSRELLTLLIDKAKVFATLPETTPLVEIQRHLNELLSFIPKDISLTNLANLAVLLFESRDEITVKHISRTGDILRMVGEEYLQRGLPSVGLDTPEEWQALGILHDFGKITWPDSMFMNTEDLSKEKLALVRSHSAWSWYILEKFENTQGILLPSLEHHERMDGKGYPRKLQGEENSFLGQVMAICDVFEARTGFRRYNHRMSSADATEALVKGEMGSFSQEALDFVLPLLRCEDYPCIAADVIERLNALTAKE